MGFKPPDPNDPNPQGPPPHPPTPAEVPAPKGDDGPLPEKDPEGETE